MRLTSDKIRLVFLLGILCLRSVHTMAQQVESFTLNVEHVSLKEMMREVESQSAYIFIFHETLPLHQQQTIIVRNVTLDDVLKRMFTDTAIHWRVSNQYIILSKKKQLTIAGYVTHGQSMETLIGATVVNLRTNETSVTNAYGYYTMQVPSDSVELQVSYIGYHPVRRKIYAVKDTVIHFSLLENVTVLKAVTVLNSPSLSQTNHVVDLSHTELQRGTSTFSESDVIKSLQLLPGVQPGVEGSAGLYIRGGEPDQNLILLDGVPIYNTGHIWGVLSVFNGDAVKKVSLHKNGFPARFGGRLSSVVDVRFREGNMQQFKGNLTVGLLSARVNLEGPILKGKTSFSFSARRSYIDGLFRIIRNVSGEKTPIFYLYDMNAKLNHKFSDRSRLYLSYYGGRDKLDLKPKEQTSNTIYQGELGKGIFNDTYYYIWGNNILSLRWNYIFNHRLFMNVTGAYSRFKYDYESKSHSEVENMYHRKLTHFQKSKIKDWLLGADFEWKVNNRHYMRFGSSFVLHRFSPEAQGYKLEETGEGKEQLTMNYYLFDQIKAREASLYVEDEYAVTRRLRLNFGVHLSLFNVQKKTYVSVQPRLSVGYTLSNHVALKASYAKMNQYVNLLSSNTVSQPTDLWVPITKKHRPMSSHQFTAGLYANIQSGFQFSVEGFYKEMRHVLAYKDSEVAKDAYTPWEDYVEAGDGRVYGVELMAKKTMGRLVGWLGYTLLWNDRKFKTINQGERFPAKYDRRHNFVATGSYRLNAKIDISASWVYATGNRATLILEAYQPLPGESMGSVAYVDKRNNYQLSPTHHLDLDLRYHYSPRKIWAFSLYNLYNRKNPYIARAGETRPNGKGTVVEYSLLGIVPSLSFTYKFK